MFDFPLYLARHGQTEWNSQGRMQGHLNSPLTERGRAEAQRLGALLARLPLTEMQIRVSPQGRVLETAGLALADRNCALQSDARLMEIDIGEWSGLLRDELRSLRPDLFTDDPATHMAWYDAAPKGEGFAGLETRCRALLNELTGPTLLLTHGIALRMLRSLAAAGDSSRFGEGQAVKQGVLYLVEDGQIHEIDDPEHVIS